MKKVFFSCLAIVMLCCKSNEDTQDAVDKHVKDTSENLNISILLDLSDRIDPEKYPNPGMAYHLRDVGYINSVAEAFSAHVKSKKIKQIDDRIQLYFDPAPGNPEINAISENLKVSFNKDNVTNELIAGLEARYRTEPAKLYSLAIKDKNYVGSDTWRFFKDKVNDCTDRNYRNILVILTDGYIFYEYTKMQEGNRSTFLTPERIRANSLNETGWREKFNRGNYGFIKASDDLSNLEVLVLGVNPSQKNPHEEDVIRAYWMKWFQEMKITRYDIRTAELPSNMDRIIKNFIAKK